MTDSQRQAAHDYVSAVRDAYEARKMLVIVHMEFERKINMWIDVVEEKYRERNNVNLAMNVCKGVGAIAAVFVPPLAFYGVLAASASVAANVEYKKKVVEFKKLSKRSFEAEMEARKRFVEAAMRATKAARKAREEFPENVDPGRLRSLFLALCNIPGLACGIPGFKEAAWETLEQMWEDDPEQVGHLAMETFLGAANVSAEMCGILGSEATVSLLDYVAGEGLSIIDFTGVTFAAVGVARAAAKTRKTSKDAEILRQLLNGSQLHYNKYIEPLSSSFSLTQRSGRRIKLLRKAAAKTSKSSKDAEILRQLPNGSQLHYNKYIEPLSSSFRPTTVPSAMPSRSPTSEPNPVPSVSPSQPPTVFPSSSPSRSGKLLRKALGFLCWICLWISIMYYAVRDEHVPLKAPKTKPIPHLDPSNFILWDVQEGRAKATAEGAAANAAATKGKLVNAQPKKEEAQAETPPAEEEILEL